MSSPSGQTGAAAWEWGFLCHLLWVLRSHTQVVRAGNPPCCEGSMEVERVTPLL